MRHPTGIQEVAGLILGSSTIFYGHPVPTTDSSWAVVSYWQKYGHLVLVNCLGNLHRNSVDRLIDCARNDLNSVEEP